MARQVMGNGQWMHGPCGLAVQAPCAARQFSTTVKSTAVVDYLVRGRQFEPWDLFGIGKLPVPGIEWVPNAAAAGG
jgi:hypothetical protein